ncbi:acyl transferase/acyl hydrolase/lysophospholipase [Xylaria venustula]|nr:acyl transferase/acyl hydrolase/lysophospholipase [Xylaria venustula]
MNSSGPSASAEARPLRVLSLDGGGIRGKSSLLILENIMETIQKTKNLESVPRPCEYFDIIGVTRTEGIIAMMIGRLGMTIDECIRQVLAVTKDNVDATPTLFTTYDTSASYRGCAIWQVVRATSAATTFFKSIKVGRDKIEFIDAGFGHNNPCEVLIDEAQGQFPEHGTLQVLSIGTGLGAVITIKDSRRSILKAPTKMSSTSTMVATRLSDRFGNSDQYYRFNVDRGLQDITLSDWEKTSTISTHTSNYLRDNHKAIQDFVYNFLYPGRGEETMRSPSELASYSMYHYIPLPRNKHFVGRTQTLQLLNQKLFSEDGHQRFLTIQTAREDDPRTVLQKYINSNKVGNWFLVIDNIDEMTTLQGSSDQPEGDETIESREMNPEEAKRYLEEKVQLGPQEDAAVTELLSQLTYLPLAVTQAAAYVKRNKIPIARYLKLLRKTESMTELMSWEFFDKDRYEGSQNAVALTWHVSFNQVCDLDPTAADLLRFISRIESKAIPRSILPNEESEIRLITAIGTLLGHAFLAVRDGGDIEDGKLSKEIELLECVISMQKAGDYPEVSPDHTQAQQQLALAYSNHGELPKAIELLEHIVSIEKAVLPEVHPGRLLCQHYLATTYELNGQPSKAVELLEEMMLDQEAGLPGLHSGRIGCQHSLGMAYRHNEQLSKAVELLEDIISKQKVLYPEAHHDHLLCQTHLALAYKENKQPLQAIQLLERVVLVPQTALSKDDPKMLEWQRSLEEIYEEMDRQN